MMEKKDFLITVRIPIKANDDVDARLQARKILEEKGIEKENAKLQRVYENKAPEGIWI